MRILAGCALLAALSSSTEALAQPAAATKEACVEAHAQGQKRRRAGQLAAGLELFLQCAREACPAPLRAECSQWAQEVQASMPTVVLEVPARDGSLLADVEVRVDGELRDNAAAGMPIAIDPGEHVVEVRPRGEPPRRRKVLLVLGERARRVRFDPEAPPLATSSAVPGVMGAAPERSIQPPGVPSIVVGSVGLAALVVGTVFGVRAADEASDLERCRPTCVRADAEAMRTKALVADVSFGIGAGALAAATILWLIQPSTRPASSAAQRRFASRFGGGQTFALP
jgi:hypothetical protein